MDVRITPYPDGPLIVRGPITIDDVDGNPIRTSEGSVALCRCGLSADKPFCDGSHKRGNFRSVVRGTPAADVDAAPDVVSIEVPRVTPPGEPSPPTST
jgi:CDGSH-type Zn-finger protein